VLAQPVRLEADDVLTFDADCFIRSDAPVASLIPGRVRTSPNQVALVIEHVDGKAIAHAEAREGKWTLGTRQESKVAVPYDCWMHLQVAVNMKTRICTFVQQQIGQVAQPLGTAPLPADIQPGQPLAFRIQLGPDNTCVVVDNVKITRGSTAKVR